MYDKEYYEANRSAIREQQKEYQKVNKEKESARKKAYRLANKEKLSAAQKAWRLKNPDRKKMECQGKIRDSAYINRNKNRGPVVLANHLREVWR